MTSSKIPAITMPKWGLTMTKGKIVGWLKQPAQVFAEAGNALKRPATSID
jgi:hypothetical protein